MSKLLLVSLVCIIVLRNVSSISQTEAECQTIVSIVIQTFMFAMIVIDIAYTNFHQCLQIKSFVIGLVNIDKRICIRLIQTDRVMIVNIEFAVSISLSFISKLTCSCLAVISSHVSKVRQLDKFLDTSIFRVYINTINLTSCKILSFVFCVVSFCNRSFQRSHIE